MLGLTNVTSNGPDAFLFALTGLFSYSKFIETTKIIFNPIIGSSFVIHHMKWQSTPYFSSMQQNLRQKLHALYLVRTFSVYIILYATNCCIKLSMRKNIQASQICFCIWHQVHEKESWMQMYHQSKMVVTYLFLQQLIKLSKPYTFPTKFFGDLL